jgi:hypothetical protein
VLDIFMLADAGRKVHKRRSNIFGMQLHVLDASTENDFDLVFRAAAQLRASR